MDPRFQRIWKMAVESIGEDAPAETDLSKRTPEDLEFLKNAMEQGMAGVDNDIDEMLTALKDASNGNDVAENLHYVSEICEVHTVQRILYQI